MAAASTEGLQSAWVQFHENDAYLYPAAVFPGDERVRPAAYAACMSDNWYTQTTPRFAAAAESFGLGIGATSYERGKRVLSAAHWFDAWLDDKQADPEERFAGYEWVIRSSLTDEPGKAAEVVDQLSDDPRLLTATELLGNAVRPLPAEEREQLSRLGLSIGYLGRQKTLTADAALYRFLTLGEGYRTGVLFARSLINDMPETHAVRSFCKWMGTSLGYFTLRDSRKDLAADYQEGRTLVRPTSAC